MKSLTNGAFALIAVLVIFGLGVMIMTCSDEDKGVSPSKAVNTYNAIYDAADNFVMVLGRSVDKDSRESGIIKVNGTLPLWFSYVLEDSDIFAKPLPNGYTWREITEEQFAALPCNSVGDLPNDVNGMWRNESTGIFLSVAGNNVDVVFATLVIGNTELPLPGVSMSNLKMTLASGFERW